MCWIFILCAYKLNTIRMYTYRGMRPTNLIRASNGPYNMFRAHYMRAHPMKGVLINDIVKKIGEEWHLLSIEEKAHWKSHYWENRSNQRSNIYNHCVICNLRVCNQCSLKLSVIQTRGTKIIQTSEAQICLYETPVYCLCSQQRVVKPTAFCKTCFLVTTQMILKHICTSLAGIVMDYLQ
jgi:hypothetical protein